MTVALPARRAAFAVMLLVSVVVLFTPASGVPSGLPINDKVVHFLLFGALALTGRAAGVRPVGLAVGLVAYAGLSEVLQTVLPINRDGDVLDAVADSIGVLVGVALAEMTVRRAASRASAGRRATRQGW